MKRKEKSEPTQIKLLLAEKEANWRWQKVVEKVLKNEQLKVDETKIMSLVENEDLVELVFYCQQWIDGARVFVYYELSLKKADRMRYKIQEISHEEYLTRKGVYIKNEE